MSPIVGLDRYRPAIPALARLLVCLIVALLLDDLSGSVRGAGVTDGTIILSSGTNPTSTAGGNSVLVRTDLQGHIVTLVSRPGAVGVASPARSPDRRLLAYVVDGTSLWQSDPDGHDTRLLYALSAGTFARLIAPRYAPDGRTLAFTAGCCGSFTIYSIPTAGGRPRPLLAGGVRFLQDWSPDGRVLLFTLNGALWTADAQGRHARPMGGDVPGAGSFFDARYSPDGSHIAAGLRPAQGVAEATGRVVVLLHADGRYLTILTGDLSADAALPTWSPDGKNLAFVVASGAFGPQGRLHDLWLMRFDGVRKRNLTHGTLGDVGAAIWAR